MEWSGERFEYQKLIGPEDRLGGATFDRCTFAGCCVMQASTRDDGCGSRT